MEYSLVELGTYEEECRKKVAIGRMFTGTIGSMVNIRGLQLECAMDVARASSYLG